MSVSVIVVAAGLSRRMGEDKNKLILPFGETVLFCEVLKNIIASDVEEVIVVLGHEADLVEKYIPVHPKIKMVINPNYSEGMTSSIQSGVRAALEKNAYMICLSDMPFISSEEYNFLIKTFENQVFFEKKTILQPFFQEKKGNPIIFSNAYRDLILSHFEKEGCREIVRNHSHCVYLAEMPTDSILRDIDDWETYIKDLSLVKT
jgi:molybdenum cofactor cytidylyltransferase